MIVETRIDWVMCWMNRMNKPTLASSRRNEKVTATCGTNGGTCSSPLTERSTTTAYTKVAANTPSAAWLVRLRRNERSTRGENWLLVSCSTTTVIETPTR